MIRCTTVLQWEYAPPPNFEQNRMVYIWLWDCGYGVESWGGQQLYAQIFAHSQTCMWWMLPRPVNEANEQGVVCIDHCACIAHTTESPCPCCDVFRCECTREQCALLHLGKSYCSPLHSTSTFSACDSSGNLSPLILGGHLLCLLWQHVTCITFANCVYSDMMKK